MEKKKKIILISILASVLTLGLAIAIPFTILGIKTNNIKADWDYLKTDITYNQKVEVEGVNLVKQDISCGYATIEMMSDFYGNKITEEDLSNKNGGGISTSSTKGFFNEISDSIKNKEFTSKTYLKNDEMLKEIHRSLSANNPVAIEWAAKYEDEWTLHFSLVTSLDIASDCVTVYNPYGFVENISIYQFINRTTFEAYEDMPLFLNFGIAFGAFHKNAIFSAK